MPLPAMANRAPACLLTTKEAHVLTPCLRRVLFIVWWRRYLEGIREMCDEFGIVMVCDEVMAGFGRTGKMFGFMHADVVPDIVTFAKGVNGAFVPLGGVGVRDHVAGVSARRAWKLAACVLLGSARALGVSGGCHLPVPGSTTHTTSATCSRAPSVPRAMRLLTAVPWPVLRLLPHESCWHWVDLQQPPGGAGVGPRCPPGLFAQTPLLGDLPKTPPLPSPQSHCKLCSPI